VRHEAARARWRGGGFPRFCGSGNRADAELSMAPIEHERSIGDYGYKYPRWISFKARGAGKPRLFSPRIGRAVAPHPRDPRRRKRRREIREIMVRLDYAKIGRYVVDVDERVARIRVKDDRGASMSRHGSNCRTISIDIEAAKPDSFTSHRCVLSQGYVRRFQRRTPNDPRGGKSDGSTLSRKFDKISIPILSRLMAPAWPRRKRVIKRATALANHLYVRMLRHSRARNATRA